MPYKNMCNHKPTIIHVNNLHIHQFIMFLTAATHHYGVGLTWTCFISSGSSGFSWLVDWFLAGSHSGLVHIDHALHTSLCELVQSMLSYTDLIVLTSSQIILMLHYWYHANDTIIIVHNYWHCVFEYYRSARMMYYTSIHSICILRGLALFTQSQVRMYYVTLVVMVFTCWTKLINTKPKTLKNFA